jgi:hypothetical protein
MYMNYVRVPLKGGVPTPVSMNADFTQATPYLVERMFGYSILANVVATSGTLGGTLTLQASNCAFLDNVNMNVNPNAVWVDIPNTSVTVSTPTNAQVMWNMADIHYESVRVVWTHTGGQGTFTPYFMAKGG